MPESGAVVMPSIPPPCDNHIKDSSSEGGGGWTKPTVAPAPAAAGSNTTTTSNSATSSNNALPPPGFNNNQDAAAAAALVAATNARNNNERSSSFSNLAAALGTGLAESMENSTRSGSVDMHRSSSGTSLLSDSFLKGSNGGSFMSGNAGTPNTTNTTSDLSYARMMRHAGSRLLGSSPGKDAFNGTTGFSESEAGSLLASLNLRDSSKKPQGGAVSAGLGLNANASSMPSFDGYNAPPAANTIFENSKFPTATGVAPPGSGLLNTAFSTDGADNANANRYGIADSPSSNHHQHQHHQQQRQHSPKPNGTAAYPISTMGGAGAGNALYQNHYTQHQSQQPPSSRLAMTKDLGVTVMEPSDTGAAIGPGVSNAASGAAALFMKNNTAVRTDGRQIELERGMQSLWSNSAPTSNDPSKTASKNSAGALSRTAEEELRHFTWDTRHQECSRTLAILHASMLSPNDVRIMCEQYGVIDSFRADFVDRGVYFVGYYDIRAAEYAARELQPILTRRAAAAANGNDSARIEIRYCVPLNSASQNDETLVVLTDIPREVEVHRLAHMLSSYGSVRSLKSLGGMYGGSSYVAEFNDVQDAKQALLELEGTQPWGPNVMIEFGTRNPSDRKRGREILSLIGRWRHGHGNIPNSAVADTAGGSHHRHTHQTSPHRNNPPPHYQGHQPGRSSDRMAYGGGSSGSRMQYNERGGGRYPSNDPYSPNLPPQHTGRGHDSRYDRGGYTPSDGNDTQLVLGPDGKYTYVPVDRRSSPYGHNAHHSGGSRGGHSQSRDHMNMSPAHHHHSNSPHGHHSSQRQYYGGSGSGGHNGSPRHTGNNSSPPYSDSHQHGNRHYPSRDQQYMSDANSVGGHSHNSHKYSHADARSVGTGMSTLVASVTDEKDKRNLTLNLDLVESGQDTRTSLMVRNIPNKYTQQMLLTEFNEYGHGPGVIDFFYLPIDFKNRCNRGYAFINFVDYRDILDFHQRYFGKHWRTFNSDKICAITYARIQGKSAMLKRFENSALMEKGDEYKPLVFVSHGADKGIRIPFPDPSNHPNNGNLSNSNHHNPHHHSSSNNSVGGASQHSTHSQHRNAAGSSNNNNNDNLGAKYPTAGTTKTN